MKQVLRLKKKKDFKAMYIGTEADDIQGIKVANITLFLVAQNFLLGTRNGETSSKVSPSKTAID